MSPTVLLAIMVVLWVVTIAALVLGATTQFAMSKMKGRIDSIAKEQVRRDLEETSVLDEDERKKPLLQRLLVPLFHVLGGSMVKKGDKSHGSQVAQLIEQAGYPWGLGVMEYMGLKTFVALVALLAVIPLYPVLMVMIGKLAANPSFGIKPGQTKLLITCIALIFPIIGYSFPDFYMRHLIKKRLSKMKKEMADVVDLIVLGIEAGLGFDGAVGAAVDKLKGPLTEELGRCLGEIGAGKSRADAFRALATRAKMAELSLLVAAIEQAEKLGVGLGQALRAQATELRERRMLWAREQAAKLPVKMIFPLVFFIFPSLFIVILGPAGVQFMQMSKSGAFGF